MTPFWSCRETSRLIAEGEPSFWARLHLLYCRHCRRFRRQIRLLGAVARRRAGELALPDVGAVQVRVLSELG